MIRTKKEIKTMSNILDLVGRIFISLIFLLLAVNGAKDFSLDKKFS